MGIVKRLKFKRGETPKSEIIGQAHKLGLQNEPSFVGADCCFIRDGWISFGEIGSSSWKNEQNNEISEDQFMELTKVTYAQLIKST